MDEKNLGKSIDCIATTTINHRSSTFKKSLLPLETGKPAQSARQNVNWKKTHVKLTNMIKAKMMITAFKGEETILQKTEKLYLNIVNSNTGSEKKNPSSPSKSFRRLTLPQKFAQNLKREIKRHALSENQFNIVNDVSFASENAIALRREKLKLKIQSGAKKKLKRFHTLKKMKKYVESHMLDGINYCISHQTLKQFGNLIKPLFEVLTPDGPFRLFFDLLGLVLIIVEVITIPLLISFPELDTTDAELMKSSITIYFALDMILNFNTGFYERGDLVTKRKKIAPHYLKSWFTIDFVSVFPLDNVLSLFDDQENENSTQNSQLLRLLRFMKFLKLVRLLRAFKLTTIFEKIEDYFQFSPAFNTILAFIRLVFLMLFIAHWMGCLWHFIGMSDLDSNPMTWIVAQGVRDEDWGSRYSLSIYWAVTTMITVGYGDITPITTLERIYCVICMVMACGIFGYVMNRVGNIFSSFAETSQEFKEKLFQINQYMIRKNVPKHMQSKVRRYVNFSLNPEKRATLDEASFFKLISKKLKEEIICFTNGNLIHNYSIFLQNFSADIQKKVAFLLKEQIYGPDEMIISSKNDNLSDRCIYFIETGMVALFMEDAQTDLKHLKNGQVFGQLTFFTNLKVASSAKSLDFSSIFTLRSEEFLELIERENFRKDKESYFNIKHRIEFYNEYEILEIICYSCEQKNHLITDCPEIHYVPQMEDVLQNNNESNLKFKKLFQRNLIRKKYNARLNLPLSQSTIHAIIDIFYMLGEDGVKSFPEFRIDINFDDLISENRLGHPTLSEKIIIMQNDQIDLRFDSNISSRFKVENGVIPSIDFMKSSQSSPKNLNSNDESNISFNIDKIEIMTKYFPHNNFDKVVKFWNIISLQKENERRKKLADFEKKREKLNSIIQKKNAVRKRQASAEGPLTPIRKSDFDGEGITKACLHNEETEEISYIKMENSKESIVNQNISVENTLNIKTTMKKAYNSSLGSGSSEEIMYEKQTDSVLGQNEIEEYKDNKESFNS